MEAQFHSFRNSPLDGEWWASQTGRFSPGKERPYPLNRRIGEPQRRPGRFAEEKNLLLMLEFESWILQSVGQTVYWPQQTRSKCCPRHNDLCLRSIEPLPWRSKNRPPKQGIIFLSNSERQVELYIHFRCIYSFFHLCMKYCVAHKQNKVCRSCSHHIKSWAGVNYSA